MKRITTPELVRRLRRRLRTVNTTYEVRKVVNQIRRAGVVEEFRRGSKPEVQDIEAAQEFSDSQVISAIRDAVQRERT